MTVRRGLAGRLVVAARDALSTVDAAAARKVLAADLALLASLDAQVTEADAELARLLPASPYATLTSVPGWGVVRAAVYGAARGDPGRHPARPSSTAPPGCPRCSTSPPASAATAPSAGRAASNSAGP